MVMADQDLARRVAFGFLNELMKRVSWECSIYTLCSTKLTLLVHVRQSAHAHSTSLYQFTASYSHEDIVSAPVYGMASQFNRQIEDLMSTFSKNPPADPIKQAQEEIGGVKQIMVQNIEQILARGERIELLVDKTDNMSHQARAFRKRSQALRRRQWWRNTKLTILSGLVVLVSTRELSMLLETDRNLLTHPCPKFRSFSSCLYKAYVVDADLSTYISTTTCIPCSIAELNIDKIAIQMSER
jgi:hypothetical protein